MYHFATLLTVAVSFAAFTSSLVIPRATPPKGWLTSVLEPYDTYHVRYMALSCNTEHNTTFFEQCCHPLLAGESLSDRPVQCDPATDDEDLPFCDDGDDGETTTEAVPAATTTAEASTTPAAAPKQVPTTSSKAVAVPSPAADAAPTPSPEPKAAPAPAPAPAPSPPPAAAPAPAPASDSSNVNTGGFATFFYQNGVAGACGKVNPDSAFIAAIDADRYGNTGEVSSLCGKQVKITNTQNQQTVTVTIADACPTCDNSNSIDLSKGAFSEIATLDQGIVPISWEFV